MKPSPALLVNSAPLQHYTIKHLLDLASPQDIIAVIAIYPGMMGVSILGYTWTFRLLAQKYHLRCVPESLNYADFTNKHHH